MSAFQQYNVQPWLTPVRLAATTNQSGTYSNGPLNNGVDATFLYATGALTIDGTTVNVGDRVLFAGQTLSNQNGIYVCNVAGAVGVAALLQRAADQQSIEQLHAGFYVSVAAGTALAGAMFVIVEPLPAILGISPMAWANVSAESSSGGGLANRVLYVDAGGSDTIGNGSVTAPFATIAKANSVVSGATNTSRWIVSIGAGLFAETSNILLKPFVWYVGRGYDGTTISSPNNLVGADPSFATAVNARVGLHNLALSGTGITFDLDAIGGANASILDVSNLTIGSDLIFKGRTFGADAIRGFDNFVLGNIQISNAGDGFLTATNTNGNVTIDTANNTANTVYGLINTNMVGNLAITASGGASNATTVSASYIGGTVTVTGATTTVAIDAVSLPALSASFVKIGGPTINFATNDYGIGVTHVPVNYTAASATVDGNFTGIDTKLGLTKSVHAAAAAGGAAAQSFVDAFCTATSVVVGNWVTQTTPAEVITIVPGVGSFVVTSTANAGVGTFSYIIMN